MNPSYIGLSGSGDPRVVEKHFRDLGFRPQHCFSLCFSHRETGNALSGGVERVGCSSIKQQPSQRRHAVTVTSGRPTIRTPDLKAQSGSSVPPAQNLT